MKMGKLSGTLMDVGRFLGLFVLRPGYSDSDGAPCRC